MLELIFEKLSFLLDRSGPKLKDRLDFLARLISAWEEDLDVNFIAKETRREVLRRSHVVRCLICFELFGSDALLTQHKRQMHHESDVDLPADDDLHVQEDVGVVTEAGEIGALMVPQFGDVSTEVPEAVGEIVTVVETREVEPKTENTSKYDKKLECEVCKRRFKQRAHLSSHMRLHTGEKPFECSVCMKAFRQTSHLRNHMLVHTGRTPQKCHECGKEYSTPGAFKQHMDTHNGVGRLKCDICNGDRTYTKRSLYTHKKSVHAEIKRYKCFVCSKRCAIKAHLEEHMRVHTGEKPFACSVCERAFSTRGQVTTHLRTHTGEKPFQCARCGKRYAHSSHLKVHMRAHTGEKPYVCDHCGRGFSTSAKVKRHAQLLHSTQRDHLCQICNRGYTSARALGRHLSDVHLSVFQCDDCLKTFKTKGNLKAHMKTHSKGVVF